MAISKIASAGITADFSNTLTAADLAPNSVDSSELVDGAIDTSHLGNLQVTAAKVASDVATTAGSQTLTNKTLVAPALGTPASGVMTNMTGAVTASIVDDAVTGAKIENNPTIAGNLTVSGTTETGFVYKTFNFLVVAGGGSGSTGYQANAAGGGAGGFRASWNNEGSGGFAKSEASQKFIKGATYTITIGAGGQRTQNNPGAGEHGFNGENSRIVGIGIDITSNGGGAGTYQGPGASGGSGGGSGWNTTGQHNVDHVNAANGGGTAGQGHAGGFCPLYGGTSAYSQPGGGGAGWAGYPGTYNGVTGGAGGNGKASTITGGSVTYAGGGGGFGSSTGGAGGSGGGTAGGKNGTITISDCAANTGSGGGCGSQTAGYNGSGAGGSGIVVIRLATADYSGTTTGSPTVSTSGSDTILKFLSSGTYTA